MSASNAVVYLPDGMTAEKVVVVDANGNVSGSSSNPSSTTVSKSTSGGLSQYAFRTTTAGQANAAVIKAGPGQLYGFHLANSSAAWRYVHIFDKATAPVMGTDADKRVIAIPPGGVVSYQGTNIGLAFANGLAIAITTAPGATDNTVAGIAVNDVTGMLDYA